MNAAIDMVDDGAQPLFSWAQFHDSARNILQQLKDQEITITAVIGIPRGGLVLATVISHALTVPLYVRSLPEPWDSTTTLVCDDNAITGASLAAFTHKGMPCAVLVKHPDANMVTPSFYAHESDEMFLFPWEVEASHNVIDLAAVVGVEEFDVADAETEEQLYGVMQDGIAAAATERFVGPMLERRRQTLIDTMMRKARSIKADERPSDRDCFIFVMALAATYDLSDDLSRVINDGQKAGQHFVR